MFRERRHTVRCLLPICVLLMVLALGPGSVQARGGDAPSGLVPIDVDLPSESTGTPGGTLAVRVYTPRSGSARYPEGAPVLIWGAGGYEVKDLSHGLPTTVDDVIVITFVFPGGEDVAAGRQSDGVYDYRGLDCIAALRDVILYAAGELSDSQGRTIDDVVPVPVLHDNIGLEGVSNGGNIVVAVAALHGADLAGHLRYIIQWETPVSSQVATRDFGRVWMKPSSQQGDFINPRYGGYGPLVLASDYGDLAYDPGDPYYPLFHDGNGNGDGVYTTIEDPVTHLPTPDLDLNGVLDLTEDFPLDTYPHANGVLQVYSRAVSHALAAQDVFGGAWPANVANPAQADTYWDIRESVRMYDEALANLPNLEAMVLAGVRDHVQSLPDKPHIRQAFEGWHGNGAWVQINPSPAYVVAADPSLAGRDDLPHRVPNRAPEDWGRVDTYCAPKDIYKATYQLAAVWQMADRAQGVLQPAPAGVDAITYVDSEGDRIAVRIEVPQAPRYAEGAPVVVEASTWFVPGDDFHRVNDTTRIGAVTVSYLWPERVDAASGARSEGVYDYGGPRSLEALRDVIRFASGAAPDVDGRTIQDLVATHVLTDNVGLFASSHAGVVATNVLAHHGAEMPGVRYLVGRENPTRDEMYPCELGHFDDLHNPVYNPFFDESAYSPLTVTVDYSTVGWYEDPDPAGMDRPYFAADNGQSQYILGQHGPRLWDGKRYYSRALTKALLDNGALTPQTWPEGVATYTETLEAWPDRITVHNYTEFVTQTPDLKVMLVFARSDHVQAPQTKPHIHQAWDGFRDAGLWVRMNPDKAYVQAISPTLESGLPDNAANTEPADWGEIASWGFSSAPGVREVVWLASVAEMADRVQAGAWDAATDNLDGVLFSYPSTRLYLPLIMQRYPTIGSVDVSTPAAFEGHTLLAPLQSKETYLIDNAGDVIHSWRSDYKPGNVAYLLDGGELLRAAVLEEPSRLDGGGAGGRVERFDWDGDLLWFYNFSDQDRRSHHDVELLPNGNLLMLAWEYKSPAEAVAAGCRPNLAQDGLWPEHVIEVSPSKEIVWVWHVWDHLIQDYDLSKENYGMVEDHPGRIDINFRTGQGADWNHVNAIDYNEALDQILLSVRQFNEIWVIDHSTPITEARGPDGDLLYRWGNPAAYGGDGEQELFGQHDAHWIGPGVPGIGNALLFNNGVGRVLSYSSVDEIALPVDEGGEYADFEATTVWSYNLPGELTSLKISGAQRLPNGNTLICSGDPGVIVEVTSDGDIVWQYRLAPVTADSDSGIPSSARDDIFRAYRYAPETVP